MMSRLSKTYSLPPTVKIMQPILGDVKNTGVLQPDAVNRY